MERRGRCRTRTILLTRLLNALRSIGRAEEQNGSKRLQWPWPISSMKLVLDGIFRLDLRGYRMQNGTYLIARTNSWRVAAGRLYFFHKPVSTLIAERPSVTPSSNVFPI